MNSANAIQFSPKESSRFGYKIWRGSMDKADAALINQLIDAEKPDIIILRLPVEEKQHNYKLYAAGRQVLHCDTLVYYFCSLNSVTVTPLRNDIKFNLVTTQTQHLIDELTEEIFEGYQSHYSANPRLDKKLTISGYKEWTQSYINEKDATKFSWYITSGKKVIGFAMCAEEDEATFEGVFSGVKTAYAGRGVYSDIVRFLQGFFKSRNKRIMKVSTQIQNYSVQKTWLKEGFTLKQAFDTYHINCFYP